MVQGVILFVRTSTYLSLMIGSDRFQLALRIILRSFQSGRYPTIYSEQDSLVALDFLRRAFHDLPTVPGNPYLNYRLPMYESGKEELVCGASCEAIVVSQCIAELFNTNLGSSQF